MSTVTEQVLDEVYVPPESERLSPVILEKIGRRLEKQRLELEKARAKEEREVLADPLYQHALDTLQTYEVFEDGVWSPLPWATHYEFVKYKDRTGKWPPVAQPRLYRVTVDDDSLASPIHEGPVPSELKQWEHCGEIKESETPETETPVQQTATAVTVDVAETITADKIQSKRIQFLWGQRIPLGKLTVFCGNPDKGKSLVSTYATGRVTTGSPFYGDDVAHIPASDVLILAAEDDMEDTIRPRLEAAGADLARVHILKSIITKNGTMPLAEREAQLDTDIKIIKKMLLDNPGIRLVVIDPISSYLGRANMNKEQEVRRVLTPLKVLAAECGVAIVMVMHLNKSADQEVIHRIGGAVAFTGVARAVWLFTNAKDQDGNEDSEKYLMLRVKNNLARPTNGLAYKIPVKPLLIEGERTLTPYADFIGESDQKVATLFANGKPLNGRPPKKKQDAREWLLEFLARNGMETKADVKSFGYKAGHTLRTLETLKAELNIESKWIGRQSYWVSPNPPLNKPEVVNF